MMPEILKMSKNIISHCLCDVASKILATLRKE